MQAGRRTESRLRTNLRAKLVSREDEERVRLVNLSTHGASTEHPGRLSGGDLVLKWLQFDAVGVITWTAGNYVGIKFLEPIPYEWVLATRLSNQGEKIERRIDEARRSALEWVEGQRAV